MNQSNTEAKTLSPFDKALLLFLDVEQLKQLPNTSTLFSEGFIECLNKYKTISSDIFGCYHFIDEPEVGILHNEKTKNTLFAKVLNLIQDDRYKTLKDLINEIESEINSEYLEKKISIEEVYSTLLLIFYVYLQENVWGPSFVFIKETEKVDYEKEIDKFNNNYFNKLLKNEILLKSKEIVTELSVYGEEPYKYSKFVIFFYIPYYFICKCSTLKCFFDTFYINSIWKIRFLRVLNKLINEPIDAIQKEIEMLYKLVDIDNTFKDSLDIKGYLEIEKSFYHIRYYNYKQCTEMIDKAKESLHLDISLTGKMGRKTKYQDFDTPVLVVNVNNPQQEGEQNKKAEYQNNMTLADDNPLLEKPRLTNEEEEKQFANQVITIKDQLYIITLLNYLKRGLPDEDINREIILSYSNKALKESFDWLVYSKLLLHRSLAEDKSTKKIERALLQIEALCNQYNDRSPLPYERLKFFFMIDYPMIFNMKKHYAELFMSYGAVMTACDIFKELNMWEDTIKCLYVANHREDAQKLAKEILANKPEPGIYCMLGELENKVEHFFKALEISNNRYPRALRCLGRYYYVNKDDAKAKEYYEKAMAINPIYPDIWFNLGCLYLKGKQFEKALSSFSKILRLDDSNSEVWGNLGVCFIQIKKYREAIKCFEEGYNKTRKNWKLLDNLVFVSVECKDITKVIFALEQFYMIRQGDKIKAGYFYYLTKIYLGNLTSYSDHDREYFKNKIYRLFEEFSNTDGLKPEVWDLYANFIEEVEINRQKKTVEEICKVYKDVTEIRLKEMRTLMLNEWEKDLKVRDIIKTVIKATRLVVGKVTNDTGYMNDKTLYLNSIEAKITNEEEKEKKEKEENK